RDAARTTEPLTRSLHDALPIPPGYVEDQGHRRHQKYFHDFFNYAGLHRTVWLYSTPRSFVSDITVVTDVEGATGVVHFEVEASGEGGVDVEVTLRDAEGVEVATGTGADGELRVADAHLWGPGDGYLYELEARLVRDGATVDAYVQTVGIRTVEVRGTQFLINGEPFYFTGFGKHEDSPVRGKGHDDAYLVHDFALLDWIAANSFRTSHYPYDEEVYDYADRQGIVVIDEVADVGQNMGLAGGVCGTQGFEPFTPETVNDTAQEAHKQAIRELVARDKNHPSVVLWSIANEPESDTG